MPRRSYKPSTTYQTINVPHSKPSAKQAHLKGIVQTSYLASGAPSVARTDKPEIEERGPKRARRDFGTGHAEMEQVQPLDAGPDNQPRGPPPPEERDALVFVNIVPEYDSDAFTSETTLPEYSKYAARSKQSLDEHERNYTSLQASKRGNLRRIDEARARRLQQAEERRANLPERIQELEQRVRLFEEESRATLDAAVAEARKKHDEAETAYKTIRYDRHVSLWETNNANRDVFAAETELMKAEAVLEEFHAKAAERNEKLLRKIEQMRQEVLSFSQQPSEEERREEKQLKKEENDAIDELASADALRKSLQSPGVHGPVTATLRAWDATLCPGMVLALGDNDPGALLGVYGEGHSTAEKRLAAHKSILGARNMRDASPPGPFGVVRLVQHFDRPELVPYIDEQQRVFLTYTLRSRLSPASTEFLVSCICDYLVVRRGEGVDDVPPPPRIPAPLPPKCKLHLYLDAHDGALLRRVENRDSEDRSGLLHLLGLMGFANALGIEGLLELCQAKVAEIMQQVPQTTLLETAEQMRQTFGVEGDFTPKDSDAIRANMSWLWP